MALWRGELPDDAGDDVRAFGVRLAERRWAANIDRLEAELLLGRAAQIVPELEAEFATHRNDERIAGLLLRSLASAGRQGDALSVYERLRSRLADDLGVDPSESLQEIHLGILRGELPAVGTPSASQRHRRHNLRSALTSFVGREAELGDITVALARFRLVTLVGPGGAGKTRLANEAMSALMARTTSWFATARGWSSSPESPTPATFR